MTELVLVPRDAAQRLVTGFEHVSGIARQWEPDHSSGSDRAKWARATEACADVVKLLAAAPQAESEMEALRELLRQVRAERDELAAAHYARQWRPIESAPRGSGEDGPSQVTHPDYVDPPKILLWTEEGAVVGYYDWYYHPGYGRGAEEYESTWRTHDGARTYGASHWMPLPAAPQGESK